MKIIALIPHYNHAGTIGKVVDALLEQGLACLIVDDGSTAAAQAVLTELAAQQPQVQLLFRAHNGGKGAAVKDGFEWAQQAGYSHVLQIDADAQHCIADAQKLLAKAQQYPQALVCANPIYSADAPKSRLYGRKITNFWIMVNTGSSQIKDGMCGFRIYPLAPVIALIREQYIGDRMDFDTEVLVRLSWRKIQIHWVDTPVHYATDGVSHFRMWADNWSISKMHTRLFFANLLNKLKIKP